MPHHVRPNSSPEGGLWGWLAVFGLFVALFFVRGTNVALGIFFVSFIEYFDEGAGKASWILSLAASLSWMVGPVSTACAKKFGKRRVALVGASLSVISLLLSSFSTQLWQIIVTVGFLNGLAYGTLMPVAIAHIAVYFKKRHPLANGLAFTGLGAGSMALPPVIQMLIDTYGWRGALVVFAGMSAHLLVSAVVLVNMQAPRQADRETSVENANDAQELQLVEIEHNSNYSDRRREHDLVPGSGKKTKSTRSCSPFGRFTGFFDCTIFTTNRMFVTYTLCFAFFSIGQIVSTVHLAPHLETTLGSKQKMAWSFTLYGLGLIIGGPVWGFFLSHFHLDQVWFMVFITLLHGTTIGLFPLVTSAPVVITFLFLLGFQRGGYSAQSGVTVRRIVAEGVFLTATGWNMLLASVGQFIGAPVSGYLRDYTGSYDCSFYLSCAVMIISGVVLGSMYFFHNKRLKRKGISQLQNTQETELESSENHSRSKRQSSLFVAEIISVL